MSGGGSRVALERDMQERRGNFTFMELIFPLLFTAST